MNDYPARAIRIVDRVLPKLPSAHGFYDPTGFVAKSRRNGERQRLYWRTLARLRAKVEGGKPYLKLPRDCEHLYGPGNALYDISKELEAAS